MPWGLIQLSTRCIIQIGTFFPLDKSEFSEYNIGTMKSEKALDKDLRMFAKKALEALEMSRKFRREGEQDAGRRYYEAYEKYYRAYQTLHRNLAAKRKGGENKC